VLLAASNFLVPNATFVVELVIFLLVLGALAKWVLPVVNRVLAERQRAIERSIEEAEEAKRRAKELEQERARLLELGREEARRLRDEAAKVGEALRQDFQRRGEEEYQRAIARASADIEASARKAAEELRAQVGGLVITVVERALAGALTDADRQRVVDQAIAELEALSSLGEAVTAGAGAHDPAEGAVG
jgi:F-type H+-transporting ATPase subunit b